MSQSALPETPTLATVALANQLRPTLLQINRHMRREALVHGISPTQVSLLSTLARTPTITLSELALREGMTAPTVSGHMNRLEDAGFITRSRATGDDRRRVAVTVTSAGEAILATVREYRTAWLARQLATLAPAERDAIEVALAPLAKLVQA
jgi:DNA-binding MarR family transcriptional regulator